jgi:hypothetical protein
MNMAKKRTVAKRRAAKRQTRRVRKPVKATTLADRALCLRAARHTVNVIIKESPEMGEMHPALEKKALELCATKRMTKAEANCALRSTTYSAILACEK